ncbi:hypothetical protein BX659_1413 [Orenia metallireducens]|jgi:predicted amidophosphoribosyltransferase|uniref:Flagellar operon protein TIGR03826 n=1 Tax=Orenia metallireducens TaxID=1413210 RepID=A0A285IEK4_9FIRM|nr:hypothetical protein [Orenia metallireducens]PRX18812.1 hypothetical protein BX659_1413 [Orenia metallireducens]SNY46399.1 hypothetical protein SAMN06265827_1423 [Orenia metallireducens]
MGLEMKLKNCKKCNHIFVNNGQSLCPDCIEEERENFQKIRDYLWDNPGSNIKDIHHETEVSLKIIRQFLREGRFNSI